MEEIYITEVLPFQQQTISISFPADCIATESVWYRGWQHESYSQSILEDNSPQVSHISARLSSNGTDWLCSELSLQAWLNSKYPWKIEIAFLSGVKAILTVYYKRSVSSAQGSCPKILLTACASDTWPFSPHTVGTGAQGNADTMSTIINMNNKVLCLWSKCFKSSVSIHDTG